MRYGGMFAGIWHISLFFLFFIYFYFWAGFVITIIIIIIIIILYCIYLVLITVDLHTEFGSKPLGRLPRSQKIIDLHLN